MKSTKPEKPVVKKAAAPPKPKRTLPPALLANARALKEQALARLRARGEAAIERIREKLTNVSENLLDIGDALGELARPGVAAALGYADFDDACERGVGIHASTAHRWKTVAEKLRREFVLAVGHDRARALLELSEATPADDTAEALADATLVLPSGAALAVKTASNAELDAAAKAFRQAEADASGKRPRGLTTTPAERKVHAAIAKRLARAPAEARAKMQLVAQRDGGAKVVLEVRLAAWDETLAALVRK